MDKQTKDIVDRLYGRITYTVDEGLVTLLRHAARKIEEQSQLLEALQKESDDGK